MAVNRNPIGPAVSIVNLGPVAKAEIELRPLTVLVGPSNTGKSYAAILIYALHHSFTRYSEQRFMNYLFTSTGDRGFDAAETVSRCLTENSDPIIHDLFDLAGQIDRQQMDATASHEERLISVPDSLAALVRPLLEDTRELGILIGQEIERCFGIGDAKKLIRIGSNGEAQVGLSQCHPLYPQGSESFTYDMVLTRTDARLASCVPVDFPLPIAMGGLHPTRNLRKWARDAHLLLDSDLTEISVRKSDAFGWLIRNLHRIVFANTVGPLSRVAHYLPASRTGIMQAYRTVVGSLISRASRSGQQLDLWPELSGVMTDFLEQLIEIRHVPEQDINQNLGAGLQNRILQGRIVTDHSAVGFPEFSYHPEGWQHSLPLSHASSMVSELAPVVLYLHHVVQPGDVLIIEEPESHLHPAMQVEFVRQLAHTVRAGIRVIVTTHSEWFLEELANLVRLGELSQAHRDGIVGAEQALERTDVGAWFFEPQDRFQGSVVKEVPLDVESGTFPVGFGDVTESLYNRWVEVDRRVQES